MSRSIFLWLLLALVGCTPIWRITTPIPITIQQASASSIENEHAAACESPASAVYAPSGLTGPHVGPIPIKQRKFGAGFPGSVPLSDLTQSGATTSQVITWNGTSWAPAAGGGGGSSPTGTGVALVSGGSFVSAAGPVNLASSTYVSNQLSMTNGGTGTNLSACTTGKLVQIAGPVFACYTASGDLNLAAGGVATVPTIGGGIYTAEVIGGGTFVGANALVASYTLNGSLFGQSGPASDLSVGATVISAMPAYASATVHTIGGTLDLYSGSPATSNGSGGGINLMLSAPTGSGSEDYTCQYRSGAVELCMGAYPAGGEGIWFGTDRGSITNANYSFLQFGAAVYLNAQSSGSVNFAVDQAVELTVGSTQTTVNTPFVVNETSTGNGAVSSELAVQTTTATPDSSMVLAIGGSSVVGNVTVIVSGKVPSSATGVSQIWTGFVSNNGGTCATLTTGGAFAATQSASTGSIAATPVSVALSGCNVTVTVTGTSATTWNWSATMQAAVAGGS